MDTTNTTNAINLNTNSNSRFNTTTPKGPMVSHLISDITINSEIIFNSSKLHEEEPDFFPTLGTIGKVIGIYTNGCYVQWPTGSTSDDDIWCVDYADIISLEREESYNA